MVRSLPMYESSTYWEALSHAVCSVCLDRRDDGSCDLPRGTVCAMKRHLPLILDVVHNVDSLVMDEYVAALETHICSRCPDQEATGRCAKRDRASCALYTYLALVVGAVENEDERRRGIHE
jgi:hypothetical protein